MSMHRYSGVFTSKITSAKYKVLNFSGNSKQRRRAKRLFIKKYKERRVEQLLEGKKLITYYWADYSNNLQPLGKKYSLVKEI